MPATIDEILEDARKRIIRFGGQEMNTLATNIAALARQHSLILRQIDFSSGNLRIMPDSFGYGEEPTINSLSPFKPGVIGNGATVIYPAGLADTTLPLHDYQVVRILTPNIIVPPPAAAKLFCSDKAVSDTFQQIRQGFVNNVQGSIHRAKEKLYGSVRVIPYDVIGSMTLVHRPELRVWKNLPGDLICFRVDLYLGLTILPGRAVATEDTDDAGADTPASGGQQHGDHSPN